MKRRPPASELPGAGRPSRPSAGVPPPRPAPPAGRPAARRPARTETPAGHSARAGGKAPSTIVHPGRPRDAAGVWRARLLAIAALLVVFIVLVVTLTAK